jgi:hypothetical protein
MTCRPPCLGALAVALLVALGGGACGKKGPPLPPLPRTPPAVSDLEVTLAGDALELAWGAPPPLEPGPVRVEFRVAWESGPGVAPAGVQEGAAARAAEDEAAERIGSDLEEFLDRATRVDGPALDWGAQAGRRPRRMSWRFDTGGLSAGDWVRVVLVARSDRREVASNEVRVRVPDEPPAALPSLELVPEPEGVRVRWAPLESVGRLELYREEEGEPEARLLVRVDPATGEFEDRSVRLGQTYRYAARLRRKEGERSWVAGRSLRSAPVTYRDLFPPAPPRGLTLVVEGGGVRLLWSPNREPDLAGYRIYRRQEKQAGGVVATALPWDVTWLDAEPGEGASVEYWLTAFDSSPQENESSPSDPVSGVVRRPRALPGQKPEAPEGPDGPVGAEGES